MSDYDSDRENDDLGMGNMNIDNDTAKIQRMDEQRKRKREEARRRAMEKRREREEAKDDDSGRSYRTARGGIVGDPGQALLKF
ncbi:MAG: hypothetical protein CMO44_18380 [Verrucomicrobiales bacterium]|nr:hypothetical protein [Verrucomicrobiales bacterium]